MEEKFCGKHKSNLDYRGAGVILYDFGTGINANEEKKEASYSRKQKEFSSSFSLWERSHLTSLHVFFSH